MKRLLGDVKTKVRQRGVWLDKDQARMVLNLIKLMKTYQRGVLLTRAERDFIDKFEKRVEEMG